MYSDIDTVRQLKEKEKNLQNEKIKIYNFIIEQINTKVIKKFNSEKYFIVLDEMNINVFDNKLNFNFNINDYNNKLNYASIEFNILNDKIINYNTKIRKNFIKNKNFYEIIKLANKIIEKFLKFITRENILNNINNKLKNIEEDLEKIKTKNTQVINKIFNSKNQINNEINLKI